jgi:hypothetical protein
MASQRPSGEYAIAAVSSERAQLTSYRRAVAESADAQGVAAGPRLADGLGAPLELDGVVPLVVLPLDQAVEVRAALGEGLFEADGAAALDAARAALHRRAVAVHLALARLALAVLRGVHLLLGLGRLPHRRPRPRHGHDHAQRGLGRVLGKEVVLRNRVVRKQHREAVAAARVKMHRGDGALDHLALLSARSPVCASVCAARVPPVTPRHLAAAISRLDASCTAPSRTAALNRSVRSLIKSR